MILDAMGCFLLIFMSIDFFMIFDPPGVISVSDLEESASHPPPSPRGSAPSEKSMFVKSIQDVLKNT